MIKSHIKFTFPLWLKVLIGMSLGILLGYFAKEQAILLKPFGTIYLNLLKMVVIPIVFFSILFGICQIESLETLGRIGAKAFFIYMVTTVLAVFIGLAFAEIFKPGLGLNIELPILSIGNSNALNAGNSSGLTNILINMIPANPITAMVQSNTLQVVIFAFFLGIAIILAGEKAKEMRSVVVSTAHVVFKLVEIVIKTTPYGVFAIMAGVISEYGLQLLVNMSKLVTVVMSALFAQYLVFGVFLAIVGLNPFRFYKKMLNIQTLAFATSSTKATLVTAIQDLQEKIGVSNKVASFILPLGASINMSATAIYLAICAMFFVQLTGMEMDRDMYFVLVVTSTIASIGAAGFPGGGIIMLGMVLAALGLPVEGISLIIGIDRFLDMFRTTINVTGDCMVTVMIDKMEKSLDMRKYNDPEL